MPRLTMESPAPMRVYPIFPTSKRWVEQRGIATLTVVMVLFFILTMVAAYTSRNIVFEQRISTNLVQGTASAEATEAGIEWALGMLNGGLIDNQCTPVDERSSPTPSNRKSFRDRYLSLNKDSGLITVSNNVRNGPTWPSCVLHPTGGWQCSCPEDGNSPTLTSPTGTGLTPSFRVRLLKIQEPTVTKPGMFRLEVNGCTSLDPACLDFKAADATYCRASACVAIAMGGGLKTPPVAPVTLKGNYDFSGGTATIANAGVSSSGVTVLSGGTVSTVGTTLVAPPGMPPAQTVVASDTGLASASLTPQRLFAAFFGVWPSTYSEQPAAVRLDCTASACASGEVRDAVTLHPGRPLYINGDVAFDGGSIGAATSPVLIVATGNVNFASGTTTDIYGLVYSRSSSWATSTGTGRVFGAIAGEGSLSGTGNLTVMYDRAVLNALRWSTGSLVRVPGSWSDFQ